MTTLRRYHSDDLSDVLLTWEKASKLAHPFLSEAFLALERYNIPNVYLPHAETWVAEQGQRVVGFISLMDNEVGGMFVHPDFQGQGIGRQLMDKAVELQGELELEVFEQNPFGRRFYLQYGFEPVAESFHLESGQSLIKMCYRPRHR